MIILGAGLAGCIAGHLFPGSMLLEAGAPSEVGAHKALLRFSTDAISKITGIPFRKVRVRKAVIEAGSQYATVPTAALNRYARKVTGHVSARSIGNLEPGDRWIAPEDFHAQMVKRLNVNFNWAVKSVSKLMLTRNDFEGIELEEAEGVISTIPLPLLLGTTGIGKQYSSINFHRAPIYVQRAKIKDCDVFQTNYFPGSETDVYRASITGDNLIIESMHREPNATDWGLVCNSFGIDPDSLSIGATTQQRFGKILPLPDDERHAILMRITQELNVYSLGRFACWRNLLLDDLPADAEKIRVMMRMTDYQRKLETLR